MVAAVQQSLDDDIQAFGNVLRKDNIFAVLAAEEAAKLFAGGKNKVLGIGCAGTAADVGACIGNILINCVSNCLWLGKGGAGVVEINLLHFPYLLMLRLFYHIII